MGNQFGKSSFVEFDDAPPERLMPLIEQIASLGDLPSDWDTYGARKIDRRSVKSAIEFLLTLNPGIPLPSAVPTNRGAIQLEWHCNGVDLEIEFILESRLRIDFEDRCTGKSDEIQVRNGDYRSLAPFLERLSRAG